LFKLQKVVEFLDPCLSDLRGREFVLMLEDSFDLRNLFMGSLALAKDHSGAGFALVTWRVLGVGQKPSFFINVAEVLQPFVGKDLVHKVNTI
jgi:hypothetical protein